MQKLKVLHVVTLISAAGTQAWASDDFFGDIEIDSATAKHSNTSILKGFVLQKAKYGIESPNSEFEHERQTRGLEQVRTDIFAEIANDINDTWKFRLSAKAELDYVEWSDDEHDFGIQASRTFVRDAFLDASFDNGSWLRIGNQVFAWGESESLTISDVLAVRDQREFGQAELQDIREQIPALMYQVPLEHIHFISGKLSSVISYRAGSDRFGDTDDAFYPYIALKNTDITLSKQDPKNEWEYALKYDLQFSGGDLSLLIANVNNNDFTFNGLERNTITLSQERVSVASAAISRVRNSWLFKTELGYYKNQAVNQGFNHFRTDQMRGMAGLEYSGINNWRMSFEVVGLSNSDQPTLQSTETDRNNGAPGYTLHIQQSALNEKIDQHFWLISLPESEGSVYRWDLNYDWSDSITLSTGVVLYSAEPDALLYPYRGNDTLNFSVKYNY